MILFIYSESIPGLIISLYQCCNFTYLKTMDNIDSINIKFYLIRLFIQNNQKIKTFAYDSVYYISMTSADMKQYFDIFGTVYISDLF